MITKKQNAILLIQILFLLMLIFLAVPMVVPYKSILIPTFHVGSIINGLVLIFCMLSYFMSSQKKYLIILFSFSALGAASDLLFIVWFVFPVLASLFLVSRSNHRSLYSYIQIAALIVVGCLFGVLAKYALTIDVSKSFIFNRPDFSLEKIKEFIIIYMKFFYDHSIAYSLIPIFYGCLMVKLIAMIFSKKKVDDDKQNEKMFFLVYFVLLSGLFSIANILVIKNPYGIAMDMPYFRYISTFLFFPVLFCWLPFYSFIDNSILNRGLKFLFYFLAFCAILNLKSPMIDYKSEYTPEDVLCIDKYIHQYNASHTEKIRYGISGYWQAKLTTLFSKENLVVVSYWPNLERQLILTNPEIYRDKYDFAIVAYRSPQLRLDETLLQKINGKPYSKSYCGLKLAVIIYGKDKLKIKA